MAGLALLLLAVLLSAFTSCSSSNTDDTLTREDSLRIEHIMGLIERDEVHRITEEYEVYFASDRPYRTQEDLRHYRRYAWYLLCDNKNAKALQIVLHADSIAHATGNEYMKICFEYDIARYRNVDDIEGARKGMKEAARKMEDYLAREKDGDEHQQHIKALTSIYVNILDYETSKVEKAKYLDLMEAACQRLQGWNDAPKHDRTRFHLYQKKMSYYAECDQMDKANEAYEKMAQCNLADTRYGKAAMADAASVVGRYEECIPLLEAQRDTMERLMPNLMISENYAAVLGQLAYSYKQLGDDEKAEFFVKKEKECLDSINLHHNQEKTLQLTEQFNTQRKEYELQMSKAEGKLYKILFGLTLLLAVIFIVVTFIVMRYNRIIRKKNRVLARYIKQQLEQKKEESVPIDTQPVAEKESKPELDEDTTAGIRQFINELTTRKLFCNAGFDRDTLLAELHIQKTGFGRNFENVTGQPFAKYLLNLRLEHAALLITEHPEYTVEAIAAECGIPSRSTFYRNFIDRFGITPTEYRKQTMMG